MIHSRPQIHVTSFNYVIYMYYFIFIVSSKFILLFFFNIVANNMCLFHLLKQIYVYLDVHFYEPSSSFPPYSIPIDDVHNED